MTEENVRRRRKKLEFEWAPTLLLSNVYFLNATNSKFVLIGYSAAKDFKPVILLCLDGCYVEFILSDWITLMINQQKILDWFANPVENELIFIPTKNMTIKNVVKTNFPMIEIQNLKQTRSSNNIFLNQHEYTKCVEIDSFIQTLMKNYQTNWWSVEDYYNMYVSRCSQNKTFSLSDNEYFYSENNHFDSYRLFKEITLFCTEKLISDVTHFEYWIK